MNEKKDKTISARITPKQKAKLQAVCIIRNNSINYVLELLIEYSKNILIEASSYEEYDTLVEKLQKGGNKNER